jgi:hypothetical protein
MTIDVEAESAALKERSAELAQLLDAGHPVVDRSQVRQVSAESQRLAKETHRARREVAARVAAGLDAGCVVGRQPPVRRVKTDPRTGRDLDPLGGRSAVTDELLRFWEHKRDVVAPAVEGQYREAAERTPLRPPLLAAARQHIALLRQREMMLSEGGVELEASLAAYEQAFVNLRQAALDVPTDISAEAITRLQSLRRIQAQAELGDGDDERGFLANAISQVTDVGLVDVATTMPLVPDSGGK